MTTESDDTRLPGEPDMAGDVSGVLFGTMEFAPIMPGFWKTLVSESRVLRMDTDPPRFCAFGDIK